MKRAVLGLFLIASGCVASRPPLPKLADVEATRSAIRDDATLAPQAFAEADQERARANAEYAAHDDISATLHAERAIADYARVRVVARAARGTTALAQAESDLARKTDELHALEAARKSAEHEGEDLEKRILIAREMHTPLGAGPADAKREEARLQASRALVMQARLICGAAKLVAPQTQGLDAAIADVEAVDKKLEHNPKPVPIDDAAKARSTCLSILTHARRQAAQGGTNPDVLLTELSAAGSAPTRDERGIVVTLRDAFRGNQVAPEVQAKLEALGRVAAAHADLAVQVVVHDATPQPAGDARATAAAAAIVKGGAARDRVGTMMAGVREPVIDPGDLRNRARNARLDIVFITGS